MLIKEVIRHNQNNYQQNHVDNKLDNIDTKHLEKANYMIDDLEIYKKNNNKNFYVFNENGYAIAFLSLFKFKDNIFEIKLAGTKKSYKRKGIMKNLYKKIVKNEKINLLSDSTWTKGAEMLWKSIIDDPETNIKVFDTNSYDTYEIKTNFRKVFSKNLT